MDNSPIEVGRIEARQVIHEDGSKSSEVFVTEDLPAETASWLLLQLTAIINRRYIEIQETT